MLNVYFVKEDTVLVRKTFLGEWYLGSVGDYLCIKSSKEILFCVSMF